MSVIVVELAGSKTVAQDKDGVRTGSRSWFVYDDGGANLLIDEVVEASGMPLLGATHPDIVGLYANGWAVTVSGDRSNAWEVQWNYSSFIPEISGGGAGDALPDDVDSYSMSIGLTIIDIWKSNPTIPANKDTPPEVDIGGTLVSTGGLPVSMALNTAEVHIRENNTGMFTGGSFMLNVGKRNVVVWQGFDAGSLLFTGMNVNHTRGGVNDIEYMLAWDKWYHLRQVPERDDDGNPVVDSTGENPLNVYFKQPFPDTTSFSFLPM